MRSFQFGEAKIHVIEKGEGPCVLFLHAFPLSGSMWNKQLAALKTGFRTVAIDFPGFGKSTSPAASVSMASFAQCALAALDDLKVKRAAIVGISMGGYVAFELWSAAPERVGALILSDTRATSDTPDGKKARETTARAVDDEGCQVLVERMLPNLLSPAAKPNLRRDVEKLILDNPSKGAAAGLRAMAGRRDFTSSLPNIRCPTLITVGSNDTVTPQSDSNVLLRSIPGAQLEVIPGAGHLSNLESPDVFNSVLRRFLESHPF